MKCNVTVEGFVASSVSFFPSGVGPSTTGLSGLTHSGSVAFFSEVFVFLEVVFSSEVFVFSAAIVFSSGDSVFSAAVVFSSEASVFSVTVVASLETSVFFSTSVAFSLGASVVASLSDTAATSLANEETGAVLKRSKQESVLKDFCRFFFSFVPQHPFLNLP